METIIVDRADGVVTVTLNRPERLNAMTRTMFEELLATFTEVAQRPEDRVVVITGAGGAFCSGADLTATGNSDERSFLTEMRLVGSSALALHRLPQPTIAKVDGVAVGAGCNLALGCDLVVASDRSRFSEIFARRGLSIDFAGSWILPRLVGLHKAKELALLADIVSAEHAASMGLLNRVVPPEELDSVVADWARQLAAGPPLALSLTKSLLNKGLEMSFDQAVEAEASAQSYNRKTEDTTEAFQAFVEKREPRFQGR